MAGQCSSLQRRGAQAPAASRSLASIATLRTDTGNAARLVRRHGDDFRFCHPWGAFLIWTGTHWQRDERGQMMRWAKDTALSIFDEAKAAQDTERSKELGKFAVISQSRASLAAMIALAQSERPITPDELDADQLLLNVQNGTIDLRTGDLRQQRREDYITKICRAAYDPAAEAPIFAAFLARIFRTYPSLVVYVQKAIGYGATGLTNEQILFFLHGTGANGKTTLLDAILYALGDYAAKADRDLLIAGDGNAHPTNVADIMGRRLVICSETNEGRRFDEAKMKDLVGETRLKARFMRMDFFTFVATHKIFMYSNHLPLVRGTDLGFWRRMRRIPFVEAIGEAEKDSALGVKLEGEADGVLRWIVEGTLAWRRDGLGLPTEIAQATNSYRAEMDSIGAFIDDACLLGPKMTATAGDLYNAYCKWSEASGERPLSQKRLGMEFTSRELISDRDTYSGRKIWRGITLLGGQNG